ncbi:hypothetical protein N7495_009598 [Penicillium taxi]|uniref:uncharacterized protein n=1 Tax=Penicillium taxi TaxID=168475 RepID=UPI002545BCFD|nr:uncharacterized protein N7495_009598 [Penicillium taxi]KAJ5885088.1 hypothetical protein N7495_009598 [Penicillium taxi]
MSQTKPFQDKETDGYAVYSKPCSGFKTVGIRALTSAARRALTHNCIVGRRLVLQKALQR